MNLQNGDRVTILPNWNFPDQCTGTVVNYPCYNDGNDEDQTHEEVLFNIVKGVKGPITFVWVEFDEPQMDGDGDGPYQAGEVELQYVQKINESNS